MTIEEVKTEQHYRMLLNSSPKALVDLIKMQDEKIAELEVELNKLKPYRCKNHYAVSEKETSNAVLCYRVQNCESCEHFKE